ncbi:MAG: nucleotidyltransferase family protein [Lachnospiraceae bacterium]|nr:nucleotidyltransferase family protein [Lachnospiraceae bacterium]
MKIAAVIGEYNPFHNGHALLIKKVKEELGADRVLVLMSGDYVQRGVPAITDRHVRAEMALYGGADLVISYPARWSTTSAESFAENAVRMLNALNCVDYLVFGSECGDLAKLDAAAEALAFETPEYQEALKEGLKEGLNFPSARERALPEHAEVLGSPNNILAVEYLKALKRTKSAMTPYTIMREGNDYLDDKNLTKLSSASMVRRELIRGKNIPGLEIAIPEESFRVLKNDISKYGVTLVDDYSILFADRLWKLGHPALLSKYKDVTDDLANTILNKRNMFVSISEFVGFCSSKTYTQSHVSRAFLHIMLGIKKDEVLDRSYYSRVLGFRRDSEDLFSTVMKNTEIPIMTNPAKDILTMEKNAKKVFDEETRVSNLYQSVRAQKSGAPAVNAFVREIIKV